MSLEIKIISGVICLKGNYSTSHLDNLKNHFRALLNEQDVVNVNLCQIENGRQELKSLLEKFSAKLDEDKHLNFYGIAKPLVAKRYFELNNPRNFYQAA